MYQNGYYAPYNPFYTQNTGAVPDALNTFKQPYTMPQMPVKTAPEPMIVVLNENEATSYPVAANSTVILWDKNNPTIYVKSADAQGVPSMRILDFVERTANVKPSVDYVKQDEFKALQEQFTALAEKFETLKEGKK